MLTYLILVSIQIYKRVFCYHFNIQPSGGSHGFLHYAGTLVQSFQTCLNQFKTGLQVHVGSCLRLLGLMAAASPVVQLSLLYMGPFQWWTKSQNNILLRRITVTRRDFRALKPWKRSQFLQEGGCSCPQMAQNQSGCFTPYPAAPSCSPLSTIRQ